MATVLIHLAGGDADRFDDVDPRSASRVDIAIRQNDHGRLILLGREYDRDNITEVQVDYGPDELPGPARR